MKTILQNNNYDTMLEPSDWRFSAAIVGLMQYLDYHDLDYKIEEDSIYYNSEDINEKKYILLKRDIINQTENGDSFFEFNVKNILIDLEQKEINKLLENSISKSKPSSRL